MERMKVGVRFAIQLLQSEQLREVGYSAFAGGYTEWIRRLGRKDRLTGMVNAVGALALDSNDFIRRSLMAVAMSGYNIERMLVDDSELERFIRDTVLGNWHACGSLAMGRADDPMACVDAGGRVIGVDGLRVADASVMPRIPCANINLTTIMNAEKLSDAIISDRR